MRFFKSNKSSVAGRKLTDAELISEYKKNGNNDAVQILFDRYVHLVYALCMKYLKNEEESRDAVMNIFEKLMVSLKKYEIKNFTTWIHSVTKNYCFEQLKKIKSGGWQAEPGADFSMLSATEMQVADPANEEEQPVDIELKHLDEAIKTLNTEQKICIEQFYLEQRCYKDIAEITGYSINQVKSYIQNGKRNLKIYLTAKHERSSR